MRLKGFLLLGNFSQVFRSSGGIRARIAVCFVGFARQNFGDNERGNGVDRWMFLRGNFPDFLRELGGGAASSRYRAWWRRAGDVSGGKQWDAGEGFAVKL